ncbi:MAG: hypothetical protein ACI91J_001531, partial [Yoonia sp.]
GGRKHGIQREGCQNDKQTSTFEIGVHDFAGDKLRCLTALTRLLQPSHIAKTGPLIS